MSAYLPFSGYIEGGRAPRSWYDISFKVLNIMQNIYLVFSVKVSQILASFKGLMQSNSDQLLSEILKLQHPSIKS